MEALEVKHDETWMVADNLEWEVAAPQQLGIFAIWHDALGRGLPQGTTIRPDRIIRSLSYMVIRGRRYDTTGRSESGSRWQHDARSSAGYVVRHPPGL